MFVDGFQVCAAAAVTTAGDVKESMFLLKVCHAYVFKSNSLSYHSHAFEHVQSWREHEGRTFIFFPLFFIVLYHTVSSWPD